MWLSGLQIKEKQEKPNPDNPERKPDINITPFENDCVSVNSYDVHLGGELLIFKYGLKEILLTLLNPRKIAIDPAKSKQEKQSVNIKKITIPENGYVLKPWEFALGSTMEFFETYNYAISIDGVSTLARCSLSNHQTAGGTSVGFKGEITLELSTRYPIILYKGMKIGQVYYNDIGNPHENYNSQFTNQRGPRFPWPLSKKQIIHE